ncbi:hypothetical protein ACP275_01G048100 [Erythranthe tilingii]
MSSASSNIAHLEKLMESYISRMANKIGPSPMQAIKNHPYPNEIQHHNEIEQKVILEFRKMAYLMAYLLRAYSEETALTLPEARAKVEMFRAHEPMWEHPDVPVLLQQEAKVLQQQAMASSEFSLQHKLHSIQIADAYVDQISAYAQENNDLASMEWYAKHAGTYLPRPLAMLNTLFSVRMKIEDLPLEMNERVVKLQEMGFHVTRKVDDWAPGGNVLQLEPAVDDVSPMYQYVYIDDEQPSLDWVPNGIMEIRTASRL